MTTERGIKAAARARGVRRVLLIELGCNVAVAIAKAVVGLWVGSLAIVSDGMHSAVDGAANILGFVLIGVAASPPDPGHPYGHRKVEIIAASALGLLIAATAGNVGINGVRALIEGRAAPVISGAGFAVLIGTLVVNVFVTSYERYKARQLQSAFLAADAAHTGSDVVVTLGVLAAYGAGHFGIWWADPAASLLVAVVIARVAWQIIASNIQVLVDAAAVDAERIEEIVRSHGEVYGCHRVRSRGPEDSVHIDLHLTVDGQMTVEEAHRVAHDVEDEIRASVKGVVDVTVHVEPRGDEPEPL